MAALPTRPPRPSEEYYTSYWAGLPRYRLNNERECVTAIDRTAVLISTGPPCPRTGHTAPVEGQPETLVQSSDRGHLVWELQRGVCQSNSELATLKEVKHGVFLYHGGEAGRLPEKSMTITTEIMRQKIQGHWNVDMDSHGTLFLLDHKNI